MEPSAIGNVVYYRRTVRLQGRRGCGMAVLSRATSQRTVEFGLLGELRATRSGNSINLGGRQQRAVLALLLIEAGNAVSLDRLANALWGERVPTASVTTIQTYVSHLREALEPGRARGAPWTLLVTERRGYRLSVDASSIDSLVFELRARSGRALLAEGRFAAASATLAEALALWRGPVLADLVEYDFAQTAAARLDELRLVAIEARIDADLALGNELDLVSELSQLVDAHPLRERLSGQWMLALYRCGQQSDALAVYRRLQRTLADELGIDPSPPLQRLQHSILSQDEALNSPGRPSSPTPTGPAPAPAPVAVAVPVPVPVDETTAEPAEPERGRTPHRRLPRRRIVMAGALTMAVLAAAAIVAIAARSGPATLSSLAANGVGSIDASGGLRTSVPVGESPEGMAYGAGSLWATNTGDGTVSRIDPGDGRVVQTIRVGARPNAITVTGDDVWVSDGGAGTVSRVNARSNTQVDLIRVGTLPDAVASGPSGVWVANSGDDTVQRIDRTSGKPDPPITVGGEPAGIAVGRHTVWVTNGQDGTVSRIDAATGQLDSPIAVGVGPRGIAVTSNAVWVANSLDQTVGRIDPATGSATATIEVGDGPHSIVAGSDAVWVSDEFDGTVTRIDSHTNRATRRIAVGSSPRGLALLGATLWVASGSFADKAHQGGTLRVEAAEVPQLNAVPDPARSYELQTVAMMYDGLVSPRRTSGGVVLVPDLATTLPRPTDGGRTYAFTVRRGVRYSNGAEVGPDDIRRGIQRTLQFPDANPAYFFDIIGARRCAARPSICDLSRGIVVNRVAPTITFHLRVPDPDFLYKLTVFAFATAPGVPMTESHKPIPATGPYMIGDFRPGGTRHLTLVRNPYFRQWSFAAKPAGYPDVIKWTAVPGPKKRIADVLSGRADVTDFRDDPRPTADLGRRYPTQLHVDSAMGTYFEWLNTRVPPFNDIRVRRALNYAVDRRVLDQFFAGNSLALSCQVLPPNFPGYAPYCPYTRDPTGAGGYHGPDLAEARKLIAESGTKGMTVRIWSLPPRQYRAAADYYAAVLRSLGYRVPPTIVPPGNAPPDNQYFAKVDDSRVAAQLGGAWWGVDFAAPSNIWQPELSCGSFVPNSSDNLNISEYCNSKVDALAQRALAAETDDPTSARELWAQVDRMITDDAPWVFGPASVNTAFVAQRVGNYQADPAFGPLLDQMWIH